MMNWRSTVRIHSRSITIVHTLIQILTQWLHQDEVLVMTQVSPQQDIDHQVVVVRCLFIAEEKLEEEKERIVRSVLTKLNAPEEIVNLAPKIALILGEKSMLRLKDLDRLNGWSVRLLWKCNTLISPSLARMMRERALTCPCITEEEINMVLDYLVPNWKDNV